MITDRMRAARTVVCQRLRGEPYKVAVLLVLAGLLALGRGAPHLVPGDGAAAIVSDAGTGSAPTASMLGSAERPDVAKGRTQRLARGGEPLPVATPRTVVIDAGHGGEEAGAYVVMDDGTVLLEKDLNLRVALATAERLRAAGQRVLLTRTSDAEVNAAHEDLTGDGWVGMADEVQARIDFANEVGADVLVSIHFNGSATDEEAWELGGTEVYYNADRPHSAESYRLAQALYDRLVSTIRSTGYYTDGRGVMRDDDATDGTPLYLLGPPSESIVRASAMPAAMGEALFVTNPVEAELLADDAFLEELALAYADAVLDYLDSLGEGG